MCSNRRSSGARRAPPLATAAVLLIAFADASAQQRPAPAPARSNCERLLVVVAGFVVDPSAEIKRFELHKPVDCRKQTVDVQIGAAWKKTACASFAARRPGPTYAPGEAARMLYTFYIYDVDRPQVVIVGRQGDALTRGNVVIDVREEILQEGKDGHVCNGNLDARE